MKIRKWRASDEKRLASIYARAFNGADVGEQWSPNTALKVLRYLASHAPNVALVAEEGGKILGAIIVGIRPCWDGHHLNEGELFVNPDAQRRGVGQSLVKRVLQIAQKRHITSWNFITFRGTDFPKSWYIRLGATEDQRLIILNLDIKKALDNLRSRREI